jgi:N-acetylmuramoyl-L-alanine amidase
VNALTAGSHVLKVVATDSAGTSTSSQLNFTAVVVQVLPYVVIDAPGPNATLSGLVAMSGWALENNTVTGPYAVQSVTVFVDGTQVGTGSYGNARMDVCNVYPSRLGCPNVGWTYSLNVNALTAGSHVLKVVATDSAGNSGSSQVNFTAMAAQVLPYVTIDAPAPNATLSGTAALSGWALESNTVAGPYAVQSVTVFVDGTQIGTATYGNARVDVCNVYPGRLGCPGVGWTYSLNVNTLSAGSHVLKVVATDSAGNSGSSQANFVANATNLPSITVDAPASNATLSGTVTASGWAIENDAEVGAYAIQSVTVFVDGSQVGTATYGGARADVCNVYPGRLGCPNVGWSYSLNVSSLATGSHTLKFVATDTAGNSSFVQNVFTR